MSFEVTSETKMVICRVAPETEPEMGLMLWPNDTHPNPVTAAALSNVAFRWSETLTGKSVLPPRDVLLPSQSERTGLIFDYPRNVDSDSCLAGRYEILIVVLVKPQTGIRVSRFVEPNDRQPVLLLVTKTTEDRRGRSRFPTGVG